MGSSANEVDQLLRAARRHLGQGEFHEAAERAAEAIRLDGKAVAAYLLRAEAHRRLRKPERALADLAVAIRLDPQQPGPYVVRAEILKRRNVFDQAIADATYALTFDPRNAAAFSIRAQCRHAIGDREGAAEDIQEMLLIDPTRPIPYLGARPTTASPIDSDDEPSRKRAGHPASASTSDLFADGKPVDKTYRSRPAIVSDEEAPEELGAASGYKPEVVPRRLPRSSPARRPARGTSPLAVLLVGGLFVLGGGYLMSRLGGGQPQPSGAPEGVATPSATTEATGHVEAPTNQGTEPGRIAVEPTFLVSLPRIDLREQNGWWSDRGELVLGGLSGNPVARKPLVFEGRHWSHGIYLSARPSGEAWMTYRLGGRFSSFQTEVLIPEMYPNQGDPRTPLVFDLVGDGRTIWRSRSLGRKGDHQPCSVDVTGIDELSLRVECPGPENWGLAAWVEPRLTAAPTIGDKPARPDLGGLSVATQAGDGGESPATGRHVDLLGLADPRSAIAGAWSRTGRALTVRTEEGRPAVLPIPYALPDEYDLEIRAEGGGGELLMIGLVHRDAQFAACLDLAKGKYWLQQFEGQPMQDNGSTRRGPTYRAEDGLTFRCSVRAEGVTITCDGRRLIDWEGDYSKFSARVLALVEIPDRHSPFLASWVDRRITTCRLIPVRSGGSDHRGGTRAMQLGEPEVTGLSDQDSWDSRRFVGHTGVVLGVAFSPDGKWVASSGDTTVRLWKLGEPSDDAHIVLATQEPQPKGFIAVAFSPDGKTLAASKFDGSIPLWDMAVSPPRLLRVLRKHVDPVVALAFSPGGKTLVTGGRNDGLLCFWDMENLADTPTRTIPAEKNGVWSLAFSPDGKTLAEGVSFPRRVAHRSPARSGCGT